MSGQNISIAICICTYKRPEPLRRLLASLEGLAFIKNEIPDIAIVVVDNGPDPKVREICHSMEKTSPWKIFCLEESAPGIPHARNLALKWAEKKTDFVAFIDDDEEPSPHWLDELLLMQKKHTADVVAGPIVAKFETSAPEWLIKGGFLQSPRHPDGKPLTTAATNNVMIRTKLLEEIDFRFDPCLAVSGGSDMSFFRRLFKVGYRGVWAANAIVYDWIPEERARLGWICRRFLRSGIGDYLVQRELEGLFFCLKRGGQFMWGGITLLLSSPFYGYARTLKGLRMLLIGAGMYLGLFGFKIQEYKREQ
ncbi:MAG TPA: glycosyltransferase family 2 protein [Candidatus Omnitrophota bacterium]|nr:glycosyltransferase family 2 protein [Candidatus Omnitrophota bacterium]